MKTETKAQILLVIYTILFVGTTSFEMFSERTVAYHLIYKDQNALFRLRTISEDCISDSFALNFVNLEISHIEHGIMLLSPSFYDIFWFLLGAFIFGSLCYYYGKVRAAGNH